MSLSFRLILYHNLLKANEYIIIYEDIKASANIKAP